MERPTNIADQRENDGSRTTDRIQIVKEMPNREFEEHGYNEGMEMFRAIGGAESLAKPKKQPNPVWSEASSSV